MFQRELSTEDSFQKHVEFHFKLLPNPVYLEPDKVYQPFVETDESLTITKDLYMSIASQL